MFLGGLTVTIHHTTNLLALREIPLKRAGLWVRSFTSRETAGLFALRVSPLKRAEKPVIT